MRLKRSAQSLNNGARFFGKNPSNSVYLSLLNLEDTSLEHLRLRD